MELIHQNLKMLEEFRWDIEAMRICAREIIRLLEERSEEFWRDLKRNSKMIRKTEAERLIEIYWNLLKEEGEYYRQSARSDKPYWLRSLSGERIRRYEQQVKKLQRELKWLGKSGGINRGITQEMIERAREYPFENLISLKRGFALCPFHQEKTPSFFVKNNWAHCFGCGKSWDTIAFLMEKEGISFVEAVKKLQ